MDNVVDSKQQMLKTEEILQKAALNTKAPFPYPQAYQHIAKELQVPGTQFIRQGNTLFIVHYDHDRVGTFRALNADTAYNYLENSKGFIRAAYDMGYDVLVTKFYDPSIGNIFKMISRDPMHKDMGYKIQKDKGGFVGTISLGPKRGDSK
jgi:hypothetical protein